MINVMDRGMGIAVATGMSRKPFTPADIRDALEFRASPFQDDALSRDPALDPSRLAAIFNILRATVADQREQLELAWESKRALENVVESKNRLLAELEISFQSLTAQFQATSANARDAQSRADAAEIRAAQAAARIEAVQLALQSGPLVSSASEPAPNEENAFREIDEKIAEITENDGENQGSKARKGSFFGWIQ